MKKETRAISTFLAIILILVFTVIGAFISYMWVMASYYNMPENATLLVVEDVVFPAGNFTYFNVTVLNPSNSVLDANITTFSISIESRNETYYVEESEPGLPFLLSRATRQSFKCLRNWSNFAGETVRIEPVAADASTKSFPYTTPKATLLIYNFDTSENIEHFNLTVESSSESSMNLTVSEIWISGVSVNATPSLSQPQVLQPGNQTTFRCDFNWGTMISIYQPVNATIMVKTAEGFEQTYITGNIQGAFIYAQVKFDYADTTYFNMTATSLPESTATATLDSVNLTLPDNTTIRLDTIPRLDLVPIPVPPNQSLTLKCQGWDWNAHRNETITVSVFTKEGFGVLSNTTTTPATVVWNVEDVKFDVDDVGHFLVNVTSEPCSLYDINVTKVEFNQTATTVNPTLIARGERATLTCGFNWTSFVGSNVTITVHAFYGSNELLASYQLPVPHFKMVNVSFSNFELGNPYMNVTIYNSQYSKTNVNITQVFVKTDNTTFSIDGTITNPRISPAGYNLLPGAETTVVCPWDWSPYVGKDVTVIAQTADGLQVSMTLKVG